MYEPKACFRAAAAIAEASRATRILDPPARSPGRSPRRVRAEEVVTYTYISHCPYRSLSEKKEEKKLLKWKIFNIFLDDYFYFLP